MKYFETEMKYCIYYLAFFLAFFQVSAASLLTIDISAAKKELELRIAALKDFQKRVSSLEAFLGTNASFVPDWVKYIQTTSPAIKIFYCDGWYYASPDGEGSRMFSLQPGDHNISIVNERLCGYQQEGAFFMINGQGERVLAGGSNCQRIFGVS